MASKFKPKDEGGAEDIDITHLFSPKEQPPPAQPQTLYGQSEVRQAALEQGHYPQPVRPPQAMPDDTAVLQSILAKVSALPGQGTGSANVKQPLVNDSRYVTEVNPEFSKEPKKPGKLDDVQQLLQAFTGLKKNQKP